MIPGGALTAWVSLWQQLSGNVTVDSTCSEMENWKTPGRKMLTLTIHREALIFKSHYP